MKQLYLGGWTGMGDSIYMRPFIKELSKRNAVIHFRNPWVQFFSDIPNIRPIKPEQDYRTQSKNVLRQPKEIWRKPPPGFDRTDAKMMLCYVEKDIREHGNILQSYNAKSGVELDSFEMDLPQYPKAYKELIKVLSFYGWDGIQPIVFVRPYTVRTEWENRARGPKPEYVQMATEVAKRMGFFTVCACDTRPGVETVVDNKIPNANVVLMNGELEAEHLVELCRLSVGVISGVCFTVPMCLATHTPHLLIFGGQLKLNNLDIITDPRLTYNGIVPLHPDKPCVCTNRLHTCNKTISDFEIKVENFLKSLG